MKKLILMTMFLLFVLGCHLISFSDKDLTLIERAEELGIDPKIALQVSDPNDLRKITSTPTTKNDLVKEIEKGIARLGNKANLNYIDVSKVTDLSWLFNGNSGGIISGIPSIVGIDTNQAKVFDGIINQWDVSEVIDMSAMFTNATSFNGDIGKWNVGSVTNISGMFADATAFNQDISEWNVSEVTSMSTMFLDATAFNQDISEWDVGNVTNMSSMFSGAKAFKKDLNAWGKKLLSNVNLTGMFAQSGVFSNKPSWCLPAKC